TAFAGAPPFPDADVVPIFILGMPRSGTTLVERILARHPRVAPGGEMTVGQAAHAEYLRARARSGLPWPVDPALPEERRLLADARERYAEQALRHAGDARHVTDKHPANALIAGFLRLIFPEAPMVHVVREPMAACWSIFTAFLPAASACFTSLEDIARYRAAHFDLVRLWSSRFDLAELSYEALVTDPAASIRSLLAACRLPWSQACLRPEEAAEPVTTASVDQVRSPIHRDSVDRHARYAPYLGTLRLALGLPAAEAPATK
ncbi:MAG TPA: sulfotransferase, partial [Steroidobacteraceae bacterium]|nr:sulfotransferase [Steroidobacteraceae bacterium]